jgi:hypothetical protein
MLICSLDFILHVLVILNVGFKIEQIRLLRVIGMVYMFKWWGKNTVERELKGRKNNEAL